MRMLLVGCLFTLVSTVQAGTIPGRWEKVDLLQEDVFIQVELKGGEVIRGRFQSSDAAELILIDDSGSSKRFPKQGVLSVNRPKSLGKSIGIWAAVGAGAGLAAAAALLGATGGSDETGQILGIGLAIGVGSGAAIGGVIASGSEILYKAP